MIALYQSWIDAYPIVSNENGLDENDWAGFARQTASQRGRIQIVGDDIFVTNPAFIARGIAEHTGNAVLMKLNQIGTVSETIEAISLCREAGWGYVISHLSGETEDAFIADCEGRSRQDQPAGASASRNIIASSKSRLNWVLVQRLSRHSD